jgi:hypothetical protein
MRSCASTPILVRLLRSASRMTGTTSRLLVGHSATSVHVAVAHQAINAPRGIDVAVGTQGHGTCPDHQIGDADFRSGVR